MPRYFFDIHDGARFTDDDQGVDLDGLDAARREAGRALGEIAQDALADGRPREIVVEVKDEAGERLLVATLAITFETPQRPGFAPTE